MSTLDLLVGLGLPSAAVGLILLGWLLKGSHPKISTLSLIIGIVFLTPFGGIQLYQLVTGEDVNLSLRPQPQDVFVLDPSGPVQLDITASRGDDTLATQTIPALSRSVLDTRLRNMGWTQATEDTTTTAPRFWSTNRVSVGASYNFGPTNYGLLRIRVDQFTSAGEAVVTLELDGHGTPIPASVSIPNKGIDVQSFVQAAEFYIGVREADFQTENPWAAFNVFTIR